MNSRIKLIGVQHDGGLLIGEESDVGFYNDYSQVMEQNNLLIVEGDYINKIISKTHNLYEKKISKISNRLLKNNAKPDLLFGDYRFSLTKEKLSKYKNQISVIEHFVLENALLPILQNEKELKEAVFQTNPAISFKKIPTTYIKDLARSAWIINRQTNVLFTKLVMKYAKDYDNTYLITGSGHTLCIAKENSWDFVILDSSLGKGNLHFTSIFGAYFFYDKGLEMITQY